jgi:hypothetical protein
VGLPHIALKAPAVPETCDRYTLDDIVVYIDKRIETQDGKIHFALDKMLMFEKIVPKGLKLDLTRQ